jgi:hypothetical protein
MQDCYQNVSKFTPPATTPDWKITPPHPQLLSSFHVPVTVDNKGYLYVAGRQYISGTTTNYYIYKIRTSDGAIIWTGTTPLTDLYCLVVDSQGIIYAAGSGATVVYKFDTTQGSNPIGSFTITPSATGTRLAMDGSDNVYIMNNSSLSKVDSSGNPAWSDSFTLSYPHDIATDGVNVYIGHDSHLSVYDAGTGALKQAITNVPIYGTGALGTSAISTDNYGSVYVHSSYNNNQWGPITKYNLQ